LRANRRHRRSSGSLRHLKHYLWAVVSYNLEVLEDPEHAHDLRQKAGNALVQASMAYLKVSETTDILTRLEQLERAAAERNGHDSR
jgi:hypothetical protein